MPGRAINLVAIRLTVGPAKKAPTAKPKCVNVSILLEWGCQKGLRGSVLDCVVPAAQRRWYKVHRQKD